MAMLNLVVNFLAFQIGWFACVLGAAHELPWLGSGVAVALVALHVARAAQPLPELKLVLGTAAIGLVLDSFLTVTGVLTFTSGMLLPGVAPHWMLALWMIFATTLNVSL